MGIARGIMRKEKTVDVSIYHRSQTFVNGVLGPVTWELEKTVKALFWVATQGDVFINDKIWVDIDVVMAFDSDEVSVADFPDDCKVTVNNNDYSIVTIVDIAEQGELLVAYGKKI